MAIGDWSLKTWENGVDVVNATNMQRIEDKINELDNYIKYKYKNADESVTSSASIQDDNELVITNLPIGTYEIDTNLFVDAATAGGFRMAWSVSNVTLLGNRFIDSPTNTSATFTYDTKLHRGVLTSITQDNALLFAGYVHEKMMIQISNATNTLTLRWAQATSNGTATIVKAGSFIRVLKISSF